MLQVCREFHQALAIAAKKLSQVVDNNKRDKVGDFGITDALK